MSDNIKLPPLPKASKMYDIPGYDEEELKDYARAAVLADRASRDPSPLAESGYGGTTLRDYFAAKAMAAGLAERLNEGESGRAWGWANGGQMATQMRARVVC